MNTLHGTEPRRPRDADAGQRGRTDLGRRVAARRTELGLSREALGERCGADAHYIAYLEDHAAAPAAGTLIRLANALGTTVDDLTGANRDRTPGTATAVREAELLPLDEAESRSLLGTHGVGRVAVFTAEGPAILPVNYVVAGADIAFRTSGDAVPARAAGTEVAFEVDRIDEVAATGWSVLAVGELRGVTDADELRRLNAAARSVPWAGGERAHWMRLTPVRLTGRRIAHP
ncbi:helix-turn-helix domain-containing protein [Streptomyces sp. NPDC093225]|uniref:helix-turn-helix domain-containing protein n=1 Tax=Streptomyces sp. NPDC093225 TaxID=3366034 RepID=UPI003813BC94